MTGPLILGRNPQEEMEAVNLGYLGESYSMRVLETKTAHVSYSYNTGTVDVSSLLLSNFDDFYNVSNIFVNISCDIGGNAPPDNVEFGLTNDSGAKQSDLTLF